MNITFESVLNDLRKGNIQTGISNTRRKIWYWYGYHFSHIENIISILEDGNLYSREMIEIKGKINHDNASQEIIEQTSNKYKKFVRLYFRPKTPTQYHNEGFKTKDELRIGNLNAHCPLPVFLFFDLEKILNHPDMYFTEKTLASGDDVSLYSTPEEFSNLPFNKIYHDNPLSDMEKREIISHRQAEIVIKNCLQIDNYLSKIIVRSEAEKETLLSLMNRQLLDKYAELIHIDSTKIIFFGYRTYINTVSLKENNILMTVIEPVKRNQSTILDLTFELRDCSGKIYKHEIKNWSLKSQSSFSFKSSFREYDLVIRFDGILMYKGHYQRERNIPY